MAKLTLPGDPPWSPVDFPHLRTSASLLHREEGRCDGSPRKYPPTSHPSLERPGETFQAGTFRQQLCHQEEKEGQVLHVNTVSLKNKSDLLPWKSQLQINVPGPTVNTGT